MIKTIGIIGLGLIGGSLALAIQNNLPDNYKIYGFSQNKITREQASFPCFDNYHALQECDIVFICSPLRYIKQTMQDISSYLKQNAIVSDVGSIKSFIEKDAQDIFPEHIEFIGGHPMAGTEHSGFEYADACLFQNKTWVLLKKHHELHKILNSIGANVIYTNALLHDKAAAMISHLPLMLSCHLLQTLENLEQNNAELYSLAKTMASSGFASMTRLARGNQTLNEDLLELNQQYIQELYQLFLKQNI